MRDLRFDSLATLILGEVPFDDMLSPEERAFAKYHGTRGDCFRPDCLACKEATFEAKAERWTEQWSSVAPAMMLKRLVMAARLSGVELPDPRSKAAGELLASLDRAMRSDA